MTKQNEEHISDETKLEILATRKRELEERVRELEAILKRDYISLDIHHLRIRQVIEEKNEMIEKLFISKKEHLEIVKDIIIWCEENDLCDDIDCEECMTKKKEWLRRSK